MMGLVAIKERKVAEEAATGLGKKELLPNPPCLVPPGSDVPVV